MSICYDCVYGFRYIKPEVPENGFDSDIVGQHPNTWWNRFRYDGNLNIYRNAKALDGPFLWDRKKEEYDYALDQHENYVYCEALPQAQKVEPHIKCSLYKSKTNRLP